MRQSRLQFHWYEAEHRTLMPIENFKPFQEVKYVIWIRVPN